MSTENGRLYIGINTANNKAVRNTVTKHENALKDGLTSLFTAFRDFINAPDDDACELLIEPLGDAIHKWLELRATVSDEGTALLISDISKVELITLTKAPAPPDPSDQI